MDIRILLKIYKNYIRIIKKIITEMFISVVMAVMLIGALVYLVITSLRDLEKRVPSSEQRFK